MENVIEIVILSDEKLEKNIYQYSFYSGGKVIRYTFKGEDLEEPIVFGFRAAGQLDIDRMIEECEDIYMSRLLTE